MFNKILKALIQEYPRNTGEVKDFLPKILTMVRQTPRISKFRNVNYSVPLQPHSSAAISKCNHCLLAL